ncbi:MAG TPA: endonuclease domain-containing protein, partial [Polyangiaceae bacterium]|nr:endonuclease domain-containing protein [Polyangiaceae bacterium]
GPSPRFRGEGRENPRNGLKGMADGICVQRRRHEWASAPLARGATTTKVGFARGNRGTPTPAEHALWEHLRGRRLCGFKFRRQHVVVGYIADFYCPATRLVVELDGASHKARCEYDRERSQIFACFGIEVIRFTNADVLSELPSVLDRNRSGVELRA